jgi:hypothetical protein
MSTLGGSDRGQGEPRSTSAGTDYMKKTPADLSCSLAGELALELLERLPLAGLPELGGGCGDLLVKRLQL